MLPAQAFFGPKCEQAESKPKPAWVEHGYSYQRPGFRYGFAEVRAEKGKPYEAMLEEAAASARQNLTTSIDAEVESELRLNTREQRQGDKTLVTEDNVQNITVRSRVQLPGLPIKDSWQHPKNCSVYVLVEVPNAVLGKVKQREEINFYYQQAKDEKLRIRHRIHALEKAIEKTTHMDFSSLHGDEGREVRLHRYEALLQELRATQDKYNNAVFVVVDMEAPAAAVTPLQEKLKSAIPGSFFLPTPCKSEGTCLSEAGKTPANTATFAVIRQQSKMNKGGFWMAVYTVDVTVRNLANNKVVFRADGREVKVMSRQEYGLGLDAALPKWMGVHGDVFEQLSATHQAAY